MEGTPMTTRTRRYLDTTWDVWSYDVWGNAKDGYDVNDRHCEGRDVPLRLTVQTYNVGTPHQFDSATPSDAQIRRVFNLGRTRFDTDGDDCVIHVRRARDGYPIGELTCTSHKSLSPIRREDTP
jgi:hypothetical protein